MTSRRRLLLSLAAALPVLTLRAEREKEKEKGKEGDKGVIEGVIVVKDGPKITVEGKQSRLQLIPHWRGGMPKDGGGFDKEMVAKLAGFKKGDYVRIEWVFNEHYRIEAITRLGERK
jgi:hypothetical protein